MFLSQTTISGGNSSCVLMAGNENDVGIALSVGGCSLSASESGGNLIATDNSRAQRELISQLEAKNKEIMREISRLRRQQETEQQVPPDNPVLLNELRALRQRKGELEGHLGALQDSRRQLMEQLEGLMRMLKNQQSSSPRSTPNSSPRSGKSPPIPGINAVPPRMPPLHSQQSSVCPVISPNTFGPSQVDQLSHHMTSTANGGGAGMSMFSFSYSIGRLFNFSSIKASPFAKEECFRYIS